jgi:biopolymer transport protein ExbD
MALKKRRVKRHLLVMGLNITSLIDVLTVLIFFLVKSMTVTSVVISPPADLKIPKTVSDTPLEDSVSISISNNELRLNNEFVLKLENGYVEKKLLDSDQRTIKPLKELLEKEYSKKYQSLENASVSKKSERLPASNIQNQSTKNEPTEKFQGKIIIQADKDLPFHSIQFLLHTAAVSGFTDYQFVVAPK